MSCGIGEALIFVPSVGVVTGLIAWRTARWCAGRKGSVTSLTASETERSIELSGNYGIIAGLIAAAVTFVMGLEVWWEKGAAYGIYTGLGLVALPLLSLGLTKLAGAVRQLGRDAATAFGAILSPVFINGARLVCWLLRIGIASKKSLAEAPAPAAEAVAGAES